MGIPQGYGQGSHQILLKKKSLEVCGQKMTNENVRVDFLNEAGNSLERNVEAYLLNKKS